MAFPDPAAAGRRSAELMGRVGNTAWGRMMLGKRGGNPRIRETAHPALRAAEFERRLLQRINYDWTQATDEELAELSRLHAACRATEGAPDPWPVERNPDDLAALVRRGRLKAR